jgi:hypothetical protein
LHNYHDGKEAADFSTAIDTGGLDEVRPIGEKDRVDIKRQAENAPM